MKASEERGDKMPTQLDSILDSCSALQGRLDTLQARRDERRRDAEDEHPNHQEAKKRLKELQAEAKKHEGPGGDPEIAKRARKTISKYEWLIRNPEMLRPDADPDLFGKNEQDLPKGVDAKEHERWKGIVKHFKHGGKINGVGFGDAA